MKKQNRPFVLFLSLVLLLSWIPLTASANSPEPSPYYTFYLTNLPDGAVYVDLLIPFALDDKMYTELNTANIPDTFSPDAQILTYCEDNYRSYTFHYRNALSLIRIGREGDVRFFADDIPLWNETHIRFDHAADIDIRGHVKLIMLDVKGDILQLSQPLDLTNVSKFSYRLGDFHYDCATGNLVISHIEDNMLSPPQHYIVSSIWGILLTCLVEWLLLLVYEAKRHSLLILSTNVVSQILMRMAYAVLYLYSTWSYGLITLVLEGCVFLGEFLWYSRRIKDMKWTVVLRYTILANTLSWLLGHVINLIVFFGAFIMI